MKTKTRQGYRLHEKPEPTHPTRTANIIWCGGEGWMGIKELVERTERDVARYAEREPLKFRQAMASAWFITNHLRRKTNQNHDY